MLGWPVVPASPVGYTTKSGVVSLSQKAVVPSKENLAGNWSADIFPLAPIHAPIFLQADDTAAAMLAASSLTRAAVLKSVEDGIVIVRTLVREMICTNRTREALPGLRPEPRIVDDLVPLLDGPTPNCVGD